MKHSFYYLVAAFLMVCSWGAGAQIITTIAGDSTAGYNGDDIPALGAKLNAPGFVALDGLGNYYISDWYNFRIRKVNAAGIITTIAGTGIDGFSGDGGPATDAKISGPEGLNFDKYGNLYFADDANGRVRKIDASGIITTVAGTIAHGFSGDGGPATAAELNNPHDVVIDDSGNIYITEFVNNCVRKVSPNGIISTFAGIGGTVGKGGDGGPATAATMDAPYGIALDGAGNIYVADYLNSNIRKINADGIISTIAGTGTYGYNGDNIAATAAELNEPCGVAVDKFGNLYIGDGYNNRIRKVNSDGIITTVAGNGSTAFSGDGGLATLAGIDETGVTLDSAGDIYIADFSHGRIRYIQNTLSVNNIINNGNRSIGLYPNPSAGNFIVNISTKTDEKVLIIITNESGGQIKEINATSNQPIIVNTDAPPGVYIMTIISDKMKDSRKIIIE